MVTPMNLSVTEPVIKEKSAPDYTKNLPDAEFEVMMAIWNAVPPV